MTLAILLTLVFAVPVFAADEGYISVTTTPTGGMVYIDNKYMMDSPGTAMVEPGIHLVEIKASEYFTWSDLVTVHPKETTNVNAVMHFYQSPGSIGISSALPEVDVYVDDRYYASVKSGTITIPDLAPVEHEIKIVKAGYYDYVTNVKVQSDKIVSVQSYQSRDSANAGIRVRSVPDGASVFLDGDYVGKTLSHNEWIQVSQVNPGQHTLLFLKDGYEVHRYTASYGKGNTVDVTAALHELIEATPIETETTFPTVTSSVPPAPTNSSLHIFVLLISVLVAFGIFRR